MRSLVRDKFRNKELRKALLDTGDTELIEAVPSAEGCWGLRLGFKEGMNVIEAKRKAAADVNPEYKLFAPSSLI